MTWEAYSISFIQWNLNEFLYKLLLHLATYKLLTLRVKIAEVKWPSEQFGSNCLKYDGTTSIYIDKINQLAGF